MRPAACSCEQGVLCVVAAGAGWGPAPSSDMDLLMGRGSTSAVVTNAMCTEKSEAASLGARMGLPGDRSGLLSLEGEVLALRAIPSCTKLHLAEPLILLRGSRAGSTNHSPHDYRHSRLLIVGNLQQGMCLALGCVCVFTVLDTAIQSLCGINNMACFINKRESLSGCAASQDGSRHGALGLLIAGMSGAFWVPLTPSVG